MSQCQLSSHHDDEVQVTEVHVCAWDQLIPWLAIRGLVLMSERAKVPYLARQLLVSRVNTN